MQIDGLYSINILVGEVLKEFQKLTGHVGIDSMDLTHEYSRKLGCIHANRLLKVAENDNSVPQFDRVALNKYQCVPCLTSKARRAPVSASTRTTNRPLELIHLKISGQVENSLHKFKYTVVILDDFTAKSDISILKSRSELFDALFNYKVRSENELQEKGIQSGGSYK